MSNGGKGSARRPGTGYHANFDKIFKKKESEAMDSAPVRPVEIIIWMTLNYPGKTVYEVISALRDRLDEQPIGVDADKPTDRRRGGDGSGQPLQFYEGKDERRSEAVPGGLPGIEGGA